MIFERLQNDMKTALKAGDKQRLSVIRMLMSELKNARIASGEDLDEAAEQKVLASYAKKRREAMESARDGGRDEHVANEQFEYDVTRSYLPEELGLEEIRAIVSGQIEATGASGAKDFGVVMKAVMGEVGGRADGKTVSAVVRELLS